MESEKKLLDYASLLLEKRKVAIISIRLNKYAKWFYIPVIIHEQEEEDTKNEKKKTDSGEKKENAYEIFQIKSRSVEEERETLEKMEHWADGILNLFDDLIVVQRLHEEYGVDSDVQYTLNYMLNNIPTVALYTNDSEDGNVRINVLSAERSGSVFYNRNMKRLIMKKVHSLYTKYYAKRFITTVWRSYECISLEHIPSSVCVANGACIAKQQTNRMLLPILGENMEKLLKLKEQDFFKTIYTLKENSEKLKKICNTLFDFRQKFEHVISQNMLLGDEVEQEINEYMRLEHVIEEGSQVGHVEKRNLINSYWRELNKHVKKKIADLMKTQEKTTKEFNVIYYNIPTDIEFQRMLVEDFFESIGIKLEQKQELTKRRREEIWNWLWDAICFIDKYQNLDLREWIMTHPDMEKFKRSLWGRNEEDSAQEVQKNMVGYVLKNTQENLSEKQIMNCYEKMLDDMIECVIEDEPERREVKYSNIESLIWE